MTYYSAWALWLTDSDDGAAKQQNVETNDQLSSTDTPTDEAVPLNMHCECLRDGHEMLKLETIPTVHPQRP